MKKILPFILLLAFAGGLNAQSFDIEVDSVYMQHAADNVLHDLNSNAFTDSESDLDLTWEVTQIDMPDGWAMTFCDNLGCYFDTPEGFTKETTPINKDYDCLLKASFNPQGVHGRAEMRIWIYETGNKEAGHEVIFVYDTWATSVDDLSKNGFKLYPNPAQNFIHLEFAKNPGQRINAKVFNLVGQIERGVNIVQNGEKLSLDIRELQQGTYLLQFIDSKGEMHTQRFTKRF